MDPPDQNLPSFIIGHHLPTTGLVTQEIFDAARQDNYDLITSCITNSEFEKRVNKILQEGREECRTVITIDPPVETEVNIHPAEHISELVAFISPWIDLDSDDPLESQVSRQVLKHELSYASFCGITNVVLPGPKSGRNVAQYAQAVHSVLGMSQYMNLAIELPMFDETVPGNAENGGVDRYATWDMWHTIRTVCKYSKRLLIALRFPHRLPKMALQQRWLAEPVMFLVLSSTVFVPNTKGFPVLPKVHQSLIGRFMRLRHLPYILLADTKNAYTESPVAAPAKQESQLAGLPSKMRHQKPQAYLIYLRHIQIKQEPLTALEAFGMGYQDYMQSPLQPLTDNLESMTYEVFEKDPVKYDQYETAIRLALEERDPDDTIVVAVVGAGRGPLVQRALKAAETTGRNIALFAVEKNPNAYVTLLRHNREKWNERVTVIRSDMRSWKPLFQVDILISELLGSFGDNELSPECLDGVQHVLNDGGVCIPSSYSAHFTPIMAPKLHSDLNPRSRTDSTAQETPYVVYLHAVELLAEREHIHMAWEFTHPMPADVYDSLKEGSNEHNTRFTKATFKIPRRGAIHGLAGYFESVLYGTAELSTRPDTIEAKSKDMTSWFPIFFPLKAPMYVPDLSEVDISMWRMTDDKKVWYEWIVEAYTLLEDKQRFRLGASDLHSSEQVACLMF